jgi:hypothetical protein
MTPPRAAAASAGVGDARSGVAVLLVCDAIAQGPASYFPSIEKKYGRSIAEWRQIIATSGCEKDMEIVKYLKTEYGMGHGHATALMGWTLAGNTAPD